MPEPPSVLSPVSEAVTSGIRVEVIARHTPEHSQPMHGKWVFQYTVRITNESSETVQLVSRHWIITDAMAQIESVIGPGVVGKQPVLKPGETFAYTSGCPLNTPSGIMVGTYQMQTEQGELFSIAIPAFSLDLPGAPRTMN